MGIGAPDVARPARHAAQDGCRFLPSLHLLLGEQSGIHAIASGHDLTLRTDEEQSAVLVAHHVSVLQFDGSRRQQSAVVPHYLHLGHLHLALLGACGEGVGNHLGIGCRVEVAQRRAGLHLGGEAQVECPADGVHDVAGHVAQCAGAEVVPSAPVPGQIYRMVRTFYGRAQPEIPVQRAGHGHLLGGQVQALRPDGAVGPAVYLPYLANLASPYPFCDAAAPVERVTLVAHLCGHLIFLGQLGQQACLIDRVGQRLLAIDMLAQRHGMGCDAGMGMVGRSHHDGVDALTHLVEHHSPVLEAAGVGIVAERLVCVFPIDVAQCYDVLRGHVLEVASSHAADTDTGDVQFVTRGRMAEAASQHRVGHDHHAQRGCSAPLDEVSS